MKFVQDQFQHNSQNSIGTVTWTHVGAICTQSWGRWHLSETHCFNGHKIWKTN